MPELSDLRALLRDRQVKEGALGTYEATICLDTGLIEELKDLESEKASLSVDQNLRDRLAGPPDVDTSDIDARIMAKEAEIRASSVRVVFRALSSVRYQEVLNEHPDANEGEGLSPFLADLTAACYRECWLGDSKIDIPWADLREAITYGEFEPIGLQVLAINRRKVDVPFSLKPSKATR